ncbi:hypothetical protein G3M48_001763 [Beauveria asiatica]|uniref:Uncharacterized protein n=1 Tax=Beauveria asiatica TaxID=1069075 RepID=A0AAW0RF83_9HYPO
MCKSLRMRRSVNSAKRGLLHCFVIKPLIGPPSSYRYHMVVVVVVVVVQERRTKANLAARGIQRGPSQPRKRRWARARPASPDRITSLYPSPVRAAPQHGSGKISPSLHEI